MEGDEGTMIVVTFITIGGNEVAKLQLDATLGRVHLLKQLLNEKYGYPVTSQQLLREGDILTDASSLEDLPQPCFLTLVLTPFDRYVALHEAASGGHKEAVRALLVNASSEDACPEMLQKKDKKGRTLLQHTATLGHDVVCRAFLEFAHTDEERKSMLGRKDDNDNDDSSDDDDDGCSTALHYAAAFGHDVVCRTLMEFVPRMNERSELLRARDEVTKGGRTALHLAAKAHATGIELFDESGCTALQVAAEHRNEEACLALLEMAQSKELRVRMLLARTDEGRAVLDFAASSGHEAVCRAHLELTPEERSSILAAWTPPIPRPFLHVAAKKGHLTICQLLLNMADREDDRRAMLQNKMGVKASEVASTHDCREFLQAAWDALDSNAS